MALDASTTGKLLDIKYTNMNIHANPNDNTQFIIEPESLLECLVVLGINTDDYPPERIKSAEKQGCLVIRGIGTLMERDTKWAFLMDSSVTVINVAITVHEK